ncbi:MAG: hypothetical protein ACL93V_01835 [Candidatus Electrothrix sp. YB6]
MKTRIICTKDEFVICAGMLAVLTKNIFGYIFIFSIGAAASYIDLEATPFLILGLLSSFLD